MEKMSNLPIDVIFHILDYNEVLISSHHLINKEFFKRYNKQRFIEASNKINKWYKKNTYPHAENSEWFILGIKEYVQYYRKYYPKYLFLRYPEFLANILRRDDLLEYINNNMNPINSRSRLEVIRFLSLPTITKQDIGYAGW